MLAPATLTIEVVFIVQDPFRLLADGSPAGKTDEHQDSHGSLRKGVTVPSLPFAFAPGPSCLPRDGSLFVDTSHVWDACGFPSICVSLILCLDVRPSFCMSMSQKNMEPFWYVLHWAIASSFFCIIGPSFDRPYTYPRRHQLAQLNVL